MVKVASWNVNSIKVRLPNLLDWLDAARPDVLLLQEIKCVEDNFPRLELMARGYQSAVCGQKAYNGVAIVSRAPVEDVVVGLPGEEADAQARYVEGTTLGLRVASIYLPNGNPVGSDKYPYKLRWMTRLRAHAASLLAQERPFVLGGDYNVIPNALDVYDPAGWVDDALYKLESRLAFRAVLNLGITDAFRALHPQRRAYTFWDYQRGAWSANLGLRIDHLLLSPQAADRLQACDIDREARGRDKASDHTPIWCDLEG